MSSQKPLNFYHSIPVQVRFGDIDRLEHVNNSVYQQYYDLGKLSYFDDVLLEQMDWNVEGLVLASIAIEFHVSIRKYDVVEVLSKVFEIGNKSLKMRQQIFNHTTGQVASSSVSVLVNFSNVDGKTLPIPARWRQQIAQFEKDLIF